MHQLLRQQMEEIFGQGNADGVAWMQSCMTAWRTGSETAGAELLTGFARLLQQVSASYGTFSGALAQDMARLQHCHGEQEWLMQLQHAVLESATDGVITIDEGGYIYLVNPAAERMFGYAPGTLLRRAVTDLIPEAYRVAHERGVERVLQGNPSRVLGQAVELVGLHADGHLFPIELRLNRMQVGTKGYFVGMISTIAERKAAEERLRRSEATIRAIVEKAVNAIVTIDIHGVVQLFNPAAERLFGYAAAEVIGHNVSLLMPSPYREEHDRYLQNYVTMGMAHIVGKGREVSARRRDGSLVAVELAVSEIGVGQERQFVGMMSDLTARKALEQSLLLARESAEQASRMKSEFLANMSHELRTPMNAIMGMTHLLLLSELAAEQRDYLRKMEIAAQSLLNLINNIIEYSRLEAGGMDIQTLPFQLDDLLLPLITRHQGRAAEKGLSVRVKVAAEVPRGLLGDMLRLGQVLHHLLDNAIKFTERGQAGLEVEVLQRQGNRVQLQFVVWDSGIGMDAPLLGRLFQPFTQGDGSSTRRYGGTGMGLAICKPLVERMGGTLTVNSEEGVGTRVVVSLAFTVQTESSPAVSVAETVLLLDSEQAEAPAVAECAAGAVDWHALQSLLHELSQLLAVGNTKAASRLALLRQRCGGVEVAALQRMAAWVDEYEYEEALNELRQLTASLNLALE